jgi:hypothetical protein
MDLCLMGSPVSSKSLRGSSLGVRVKGGSVMRTSSLELGAILDGSSGWDGSLCLEDRRKGCKFMANG